MASVMEEGHRMLDEHPLFRVDDHSPSPSRTDRFASPTAASRSRAAATLGHASLSRLPAYLRPVSPPKTRALSPSHSLHSGSGSGWTTPQTSPGQSPRRGSSPGPRSLRSSGGVSVRSSVSSSGSVSGFGSSAVLPALQYPKLEYPDAPLSYLDIMKERDSSPSPSRGAGRKSPPFGTSSPRTVLPTTPKHNDVLSYMDPYFRDKFCEKLRQQSTSPGRRIAPFGSSEKLAHQKKTPPPPSGDALQYSAVINTSPSSPKNRHAAPFGSTDSRIAPLPRSQTEDLDWYLDPLSNISPFSPRSQSRPPSLSGATQLSYDSTSSSRINREAANMVGLIRHPAAAAGSPASRNRNPPKGGMK